MSKNLITKPLFSALSNLALFTIVSALLIVIAEAVFTQINKNIPHNSFETFDSKLHGVDRLWFTEYHPILGYDGVPDVSKKFDGKQVVQNAVGNRGPHIPLKREFATRLMFLGDSQTWGFGVGESETLPVQVTQRLAQLENGTAVESINMGVSGYGPGQSLLKYILKGRDYHPDLVVFTYFHQNDLTEILHDQEWGVAKPRFFLQDSTLCLRNIPPPVSKGWPNHRVSELISGKTAYTKNGEFSLLGHTFKSETLIFFQGRSIRSSLIEKFNLISQGFESHSLIQGYLNCPKADKKAPHQREDRIQVMFAVLDTMRELAENDGSRFLVITIPFRKDFEAGELSVQYQTVLEELDSRGYSYIDTFAKLHARGHSAEEVFIGKYDPHLSAAGTHLLSFPVAEEISKQLALKPRPLETRPLETQ